MFEIQISIEKMFFFLFFITKKDELEWSCKTTDFLPWLNNSGDWPAVICYPATNFSL